MFASAVYVFFTNLLPGITFASDLYVLTGQNWGTIEVVFSTGLCGIIFSLWVHLLTPLDDSKSRSTVALANGLMLYNHFTISATFTVRLVFWYNIYNLINDLALFSINIMRSNTYCMLIQVADCYVQMLGCN